ncbi:TonB-dependent receptor [Pseudoduganella flava]|uniref:TonB-dependent receptor n=1 Tax=Pseudoduganella flava TaxID=871742 RepID=A0A562PV30_9BURK|nr:TonB-dependent receptor [Pseudoduganella flava]QGZ39434.1 TonB-dependent receptor [Pseudoduganella flava]TWI48312.1 TonB-dependent receptor [Pseudoduganella flava]
MKFFAPERSTRTALQLSPVAAGCALFIAALANPAAAQAQNTPAAEAPMTTVTVTGIRRGIEDAISVKKDSTSIVEAISAEDIGKLPDVSIAESIARLPGLAAQRVAGRAQVISVRGLSPDFATTLLNGREQVSTGDNRSVEFDQYPSELLSGVTIYKTPDAGLIGQGLSGTIDLQTVRPLNFGKRTVAMNVRGEGNSLGSMANTKSLGNRFSVSYIDQFLNRTLGVAVGFAHLESPVLAQETGIYEPWKTESRPGLPTGTTTTDGIKALARTGYNRRDGLMGVIEYRPNKQWTSTIDMYASIFKHEDTANQFEIPLGGWNGNLQPGLLFTDVTKNGNAIGTATANNVYPLVRGMYTKRRDDIRALGWNNEFRMTGWKLVADASWSKAKRDELSLENNLQLGAVNASQYLDSVRLGFNTGAFPTMTPARSDYASPANLYLKDTIYGPGYGKIPFVEDELKSVKVAANFQAPAALENWFSGFDIGVNYSDRSKDKSQPEGSTTLNGSPTTLDPSLIYGTVDLGFAGVGNVPAWNVPGVVSKYMTFNPSATSGNVILKTWSVEEKISTAFAKANIEHEFGDISLRGNVGVQIQHTKQGSDSNYFNGALPAGNQVQPIHDGKSYTDYLPSMNLNFGLPNDQTLRVALAKQLARPRVDQLRAAVDFGVSDTTLKPGASGGNAKLDPWRAKAFDVSYEKYFGKKAYLAGAFFFKKLDTYIFTQTKTYDFSAFVPGTKANTVFGDFKAPYNGNGGTMRGVELSGSLPLNMLTPVLDGFGIVASGTYTDSNIAIQEPDGSIGQNIPLPGLSKRVTNLTVYYEKAGFEARVSQRKRSDFVGEIGNFAAERSLRYVVGEKVIDLQLGYTFQNGPLKDLGIVLQANNLRNAAYETYNGSTNQQLEYQKYGRTILLGVNYKF